MKQAYDLRAVHSAISQEKNVYHLHSNNICQLYNTTETTDELCLCFLSVVRYLTLNIPSLARQRPRRTPWVFLLL